MTTSGTYTFNPSYADLILESFERCGYQPTMLEVKHMVSARMSCNLLFSEWSNKQVNLWAVDLQSQLLTPTVATYDLPLGTVAMLDVYIETPTGPNGNPIGRVITPLSRTEYADLPDKITPGSPSVYWFDRLTPTPTVTLWQPPDAQGPYTLKYYRVRQMQDADFTNEQTGDMPYRFLEAFVSGLSAKLAIKWAPDRYAMLNQEAKMQWMAAAEEDRERAPMFIMPGISGYYNRQ